MSLKVAGSVKDRKDFIKECLKAALALNSRFPEILCEGDTLPEDQQPQSNADMSKVEQAWCNFLWELHEELRRLNN